MEFWRKKNTDTRVVFPIMKNDGTLITGATGLDSEFALLGAHGGSAPSFADCTHEATEIGATGLYYLDVSAAELNDDTAIIQVKSTSTGAIPQVLLFRTTAGEVDVTKWGGSTAPAMTGDAYARLGAPAGASIAADIAALPTDADVNAACDTAISDAALATAADLAVIDGLVDKLFDGTGVLSITSLSVVNPAGTAVTFTAGGGNGLGLSANGNGFGPGIGATGGATANGITAMGGTTSGGGIKAAGQAGNSVGILGVGFGSGAGLKVVGGATGNGLTAQGGSTSGDGINATKTGAGNVALAASTTTLPAAPTAAEIEAALVNDGDATALLQAIADKVAGDWSAGDVSAAAVASAVRTELATELGRIDAAITTRLAAADYTAPPAMVDITALQASVDVIDGLVDKLFDGTGILAIKSLSVVNDAGTALLLSSTGGNGHGMDLVGNGSGCGIRSTAGVTGYGIDSHGGTTSGDGIRARAEAASASSNGLRVSGKNAGCGIHSTGGSTGGHGIQALGGSTGGNGLEALGGGSGNALGCGIHAVGGANPTYADILADIFGVVDRVTLVDTTTDLTNSPAGVTAADVWGYATRELTAIPDVQLAAVQDHITPYSGTPTEPPSAAVIAAEVWDHDVRAITDKTGFSGTATNMVAEAPTPAAIAAEVWDHDVRDLTDRTLFSLTSDYDVTVADVADGVWDELKAEHTIEGSFGDAAGDVGDVQIKVDALDDFNKADVAVDTAGKTITWKQRGTENVIVAKTYDDEGTLQGVSG